MRILLGAKGVPFRPEEDIPSLAGKVILVTGGSAGLGKQSVLELARHRPSLVWLAARSLDKAKIAVDDIAKQVPGVTIKVLELDLSSLESVQNAAKMVLAYSDRLDILLLNAGIMGHLPGLTHEGYEVQFGINHMGHALLTKLLMPALLKNADGDSDTRVICLSSNVHNSAPPGGIQFDTLKTNAETMATLVRYGQSKLANALFARELAKRYPQLTIASVHPGIVDTGLSSVLTGRNLALRGIRSLASPLLATVENGAKNQLWAATAKDVVSGEYYEPVGVAGKASSNAKDDRLAKMLWEWTEKEFLAYIAE
ncbi:hypothetical protein ACJ41O_001482 [Fusarium nematophilum]